MSCTGSLSFTGPLSFFGIIFGIGVLFGGGADSAAAEDRQQRGRFVDGSRAIEYWVYLPPDYEANVSSDYPLMLFLHGGGESGSDLQKVKNHGPPKLIEGGKDFPMIVVSPQNPGETTFWDDVLLARLVDEMETKFRVDSSRLYLTGLSRGGFGAWRLAIQNPNRFAALVPIAGGGPAPYGMRLDSLPIWAFHGGKDSLIPVIESQRMVDAVNAAGGTAKLTVYPDARHDSWTQTYENESVWRWILNQRRPKK